jgi:hypothetical protein
MVAKKRFGFVCGGIASEQQFEKFGAGASSQLRWILVVVRPIHGLKSQKKSWQACVSVVLRHHPGMEI